MPPFFASSFAPLARFCANSWSAARKAMLFAPSFWPCSKKPGNQLEASAAGRLLNHLSCFTVWFTWKEKLPISSRSRCLTSGMIGAVGTVP